MSALLIVVLVQQFRLRRYVPGVYWLVVVLLSVVGARPQFVKAAAFERAAKTILKRLPDVLAYAGADEPPITGHIPLPKRRPIPR